MYLAFLIPKGEVINKNYKNSLTKTLKPISFNIFLNKSGSTIYTNKRKSFIAMLKLNWPQLIFIFYIVEVIAREH